MPFGGSSYFAGVMNKKILILGAGRSSASLIKYLLDCAPAKNWKIIVGDTSLMSAEQKIGGHPNGSSVVFDIQNESDAQMIGDVDVVVSLLPPALHAVVAKYCLMFRKHLLTASYVSDEMRSFDAAARNAGLAFINECGLDPGIDHMSAMKVIDDIRANGGQVVSFESFTGGLIAPDTDVSNPWRYKFTWNPRNVVTAGQGTAKFLQDGIYKYIPYQQLFQRTTPIIIEGIGRFEGYANRDSLKYIDTYQLEGIKTMLRGTLRNDGFCGAWNAFVQLGCCDDSYELDGVKAMTHQNFLAAFMDRDDVNKLPEVIEQRYGRNARRNLEWSGLFSQELVGLEKGTPAQVLEHILNKKWKLNDRDKDQIVMWHRFRYSVEGRQHEIQASLVATGKDSTYTAMAQTVGLPLAIACKLLLEGKIVSTGVVIPTSPELYQPILNELNALGISLNERHVS